MLVVYSPRQKEHRPETFVAAGKARPHPDAVERIDALLEGVAGGGHRIIEPPDHGLRLIEAVHAPRYLEFLSRAHEAWQALPNASEHLIPNVHPRSASAGLAGWAPPDSAPGAWAPPPGSAPAGYPSSIVGRAGYHFYDLSCPLSAATWPAVLWNAHSASEAALAVASGACASAYALCRPPGHHAGADYGGGFCYLNNAAIAAAILRRRYARVAVLDIDVHHGNGTQDIFYQRADVLVVSLHGDPAHFYPFYWGYAAQTGAGEGQGYNLNLPLPRGLEDDGYLEALARALERIRAARSEALVVSLGLDAYERDPLSFLKISTQGFARIASAVGALALPSVLVQEGGYFCQDLGRNLAAFLRGFESSHSLSAARGAEGGGA